MATGSGLLGIWHLEEQLVLHPCYLFIPWIMLEHGWPMMQRQLKRVVRGSLMVWLMFTGKPLNQMVLLAYIVDSTYLVLELLCTVGSILECMILLNLWFWLVVYRYDLGHI